MTEINKSLVQGVLYPNKLQVVIAVFFLAALLAASTGFVYMMGGTQVGYLHIFYIPIILAGLFFKAPGGIIVGIIAGLLLGPWMPIDVMAGYEQPTYSWLTRCGFFIILGTLSGISSSIFRSYLDDLTTRVSTNPITGLLNLVGLEQIFQASTAMVSKIAVIVVEISNLKEIEHAIGIADSEELLRQISNKLRTIQNDQIKVGHPHASGFVLLIEDPKNLPNILQKIRSRIGFSYTISKIPIFVETFYGISNYPKADQKLSGLIRKAKIAIERSTAQAQHLAFYDHTLSDKSSENVQLLHELHQAIENKELTLHYQPKINLKSGKVVGVEALARWPHPTRGLISPETFIPIIERTLLVAPFTRWMFKHALKDLAIWHAQNIKLNLALNFSMKNFHDPNIFNELFSTTDKLGIKHKYLEIEVTESAVTPNMQDVAKVLHSIRGKDIKISIDDFGTGQASQQYLFELPIDIIKIDQIFIKALGKTPASNAIVQSAITLGHQLNLEVVAEGIETQEQIQILKKMKCDMGQGYNIAKPMMANDLVAWVKDRL